MSLLLLFAYPNPASIPIGELVTTAPSASNGVAFQRPATAGEWRFALELADPADGDAAIWRDASNYYAGDRYQRGGDTYKGVYRAAVGECQLQIDDSDMLAPWGQDTSSIFGTDVRLDAGMLMRLSMIRVESGVVVEWEPVWTMRVETWGDGTEARGQIRKHVVNLVDLIGDLANVPTFIGGENSTNWDTWFTSRVLPAAGWLFGVDIYGDTTSNGLPGDLNTTAAGNRMDAGTAPMGLVWRSLRSGRMVIHPAPWDTTNTNRYLNPLLDVYPDGLKFSYFPDLTDIEYIQDDGQQSFGIPKTVAGIINSIQVTFPDDTVYPIDDPVSRGKYGVRPLEATWILSNPPAVDDILADRAYASSQALPLRTTLDHDGFWSAMVLVDQYDPVTVVHATRDDGLVVTGTGVIRNVVEERRYNGAGGLTWQSTVQIDIDATETSPALLPVEDLALVATESPGLGGPSLAEFSWTNPVQPDITPTEVQMRLLGRSPVWFSEDYPGVGADGTVLGFLSAATSYTFEVRLLRRVNGVPVAFSATRRITFTTPFNVLPIPTPGTDPGDTDVIGVPPDECDDFQIDLQENDGTGWVTVDTFTGAELTDNGDGTFSLTTPIDNSFFNEGSMYRFRSSCDGVDWLPGTPFDPPDDWSDPCTTPPALSDPPYDDTSLIVYVPQICAPDIIREAVSGIAGVHGDALDAIVSGVGDPEQRALLALADPAWSTAAAGIVAYGECPQIVGETGDKTISCRVKLADDTQTVVLFECAAMQLKCVPVGGGGWRAAVVVYTPGLTTTLPSATVLAVDTVYTLTATYELATGTITLYIDAVPDNSVGGTDNAGTINTLPIWRCGVPPESWITDCAVWDSLLAPSVAVTINQGSGQTDPAAVSPIVFDVVFAEAVTGFATGDVTLTGTAGATTGTVADTGDHIHFTVSVTGMTGAGTVIATIAASKCVSVASGVPNAASTSSDNSVTWAPIPTANLFAHWDASDTASITASGGRASQINDKSGNNRHLVQATAGNKPFTGSRTQNSLNVLDFQAGQFMTYTAAMGLGTGNFTVFMAMAKDTATFTDLGFLSAHNGSGNDYDNQNSWAIEETAGGSGAVLGCAFSGVTRAVVGSATYFGTQSFRKKTVGDAFDLICKTPSAQSNLASVSANGTANGGFVLGTRYISGAPNTQYMDGAIAEILIYSTAVSDADRTTVINYLVAKWGN